MPANAQCVTRLGNHSVDWTNGKVSNGVGAAVALRPQALAVLKMLTAKPGVLVSKNELMTAIWPNVAVTDDSLVQCITEIRKALGDEDHTLIKTMPKRGYVFQLLLAAEARPSRRWMNLAAAAVGVIGLLAAHLWFASGAKQEPLGVAVLPIVNLNGDERWNQIADGMSEDIISDLARFDGIPVMAYSSTEIYRGNAAELGNIGASLNVKYVVRGSLQLQREQLHVTAQLIDLRSGAPVWSAHSERPREYLFLAKDEISRGLVRYLTDVSGSEKFRKIDWEHDKLKFGCKTLDLAARAALRTRTLESVRSAKGFLRQNLIQDSQFEPSIRDLGIAFQIEHEFIGGETLLEKSRVELEKAVALDPEDGLAWAYLGQYYFLRGAAAEGNAKLDHALTLAPNSSDVLILAAGWFGLAGRPELAARLADRAVWLNPRHPYWYSRHLATAWLLARQFDKAHAAAQQLRGDGDEAVLQAVAASLSGNTREAGIAADAVMKKDPNWSGERFVHVINRGLSEQEQEIIIGGARKAGLPGCMNGKQLSLYPAVERLKTCDIERAQMAQINEINAGKRFDRWSQQPASRRMN